MQIDIMVGVPRGTGAGLVVANIGSSGLDGNLKADFTIDSFFDIVVMPVSNGGSKDDDGVQATSYQIDSFFDVFYEIDFSKTKGRIETEMVAMQLTGTSVGNPGNALDAVIKAAETPNPETGYDGGDVYYGHITVLK